MNYSLEFSKNALDDIAKHKKIGDQSVLKKVQILLNELRLHPKTGTGKPEELKHDLAGLYSRRINKKHRLVYSINDQALAVLVLSAWAHYSDK